MYNGRIFAGTPEDVAMWQSWVDVAPLCKQGIPLGLNSRTLEPEPFDPWVMRQEKTTHSTSYIVLGQKDKGKSTLIKSVVIRLLGRRAQLGADGAHGRMRAAIDSRRREEGVSEYGLTAHFLGGETMRLEEQSLNIFDPQMNMNELDMVEIAVNVCQYANEAEKPLSLPQVLALQVGINKMRREYRQAASQHLLAQLLMGLNAADLDKYYKEDHQHFLDMYEKELMDAPELEPLNSANSTISVDDFIHAAGEAAIALGRLMRGDFGHTFDGKGSLYEMLRRPVADFDWVGVPLKARVVIESLIWKYRDRAINNYELDIIPHISAGDEEADAYDSLMYLRFRSTSVRKERQSPTFSIRGTQYLRQLTKAGDRDSEKRELAKTINLGIAGFFIGHMPDDDDVKHDLSHLGLSDENIHYITQMPVGTFGLKLPNREIRFFYNSLTPTELDLVQTNAAAESMMQL